MARTRDVGLSALGAAVALLAARALLYRAAAHRYYSGEATGVGRLQLEIAQGAVPWRDPAGFIVDHTYQYFAQGTVLLQGVAWLLSPVFGPTLTAQVAAAALLEAAGVAAFAAAVARAVSPRAAALAVLPLVLAPEFTSTFAIQPYGNHTEYVWVGAAAALVFSSGTAPADRTWRQLLGLGALLGVGCVLYRANVVVLIAALATLAAGRGGVRAGGVALVAWAVAAAIEGYWENRMTVPERIVTLAIGAALMWPAPHWVNFTALAGFAVVFGWNLMKARKAPEPA